MFIMLTMYKCGEGGATTKLLIETTGLAFWRYNSTLTRVRQLGSNDSFFVCESPEEIRDLIAEERRKLIRDERQIRAGGGPC